MHKYLPYQELQVELFNLTDLSNIETDFYIESLGRVVGEVLVSKLYDKRKAARNYLSSQDRALSWAKATDLKKKAGIRLKPNTDIVESFFCTLS